MGKHLKELKIRYVKTKKKNPFYGSTIHSPDEIYRIFKSMRWNDKEQLISVHFNNRLEINCYEILSIGDVVNCLISPREIFKGVLLSNSSAFVLIHNHPSGNSKPSGSDLKIMNLVKKQAEFIHLQLIDFMIIGDDDFWSLKKNCKEKYE